MKKALFISSRPLWPVTGGDQIRTMQSLRYLSRLYEVDVVCIEPEAYERDIEPVKNLFNEYHGFRCSSRRHSLRALRFLLNKRPIQVNYYDLPEVRKFIAGRISRYDAVYCNNIRTAEYVRRHSGPVRYMDFVDAISMNYGKAKERASGPMKLIYSIDEKRCIKYEMDIVRDFDRCAIISDVDNRHICDAGNFKDPLHTVGNSVEFDPEKTIPPADTHNIVFIGKMSYEPNIVAVTNFVRNIFPKITLRHPDARFFITGASPAEKVKALDNGGNVIVTGFVEDLDDYYRIAGLVVAPMLTGAGVQNKIIQAMSVGCCVVTTTIGSEGLYIKNDEIRIADGNDAFAGEVISLLSDHRQRVEMGRRAKSYVENNLSDEYIFTKFRGFIRHDAADQNSVKE